MAQHLLVRVALLCAALASVSAPASAQIAEAVGSRALGMGGAFVAVASDSSATWWNPAGLAAGPFVDVALGLGVTEKPGGPPGRRDAVRWFTLATPPLGLSYYRLRITDIQPSAASTGAGGANREDRGAGVPVRSLAAGQLGVTVLRTIFSGIHAGTTLKYVRGTVRGARESGALRPSELLDRGDALEGGEAESRFDLDLGLLAVAGPIRLGGAVRNVLEPEFGGEVAGQPGMRLPRQIRVGGAFSSEDTTGVPLTVALDADLRAYPSSTGDRRVIALGAEHWVGSKRVGIRGGGRFNTTGARERSATAGVSVLVRSGTFVDAHAVRGGSSDDRGWGVAARISF
jgi:hypothetical protein